MWNVIASNRPQSCSLKVLPPANRASINRKPSKSPETLYTPRRSK